MSGAVTPCSRNFPACVINVINGCAPRHNGSSSSSFGSSSEPVNPQGGCRLSGEQATCLPRQCQRACCWITGQGTSGTPSPRSARAADLPSGLRLHSVPRAWLVLVRLRSFKQQHEGSSRCEVELTALELKALVDETSVSAAVALSKPEAGLLLALRRHGDI